MTKDYYKILDIPEFSTSEEIKSAYRKLARRWHPDVAGSSADVISKFKEINEAYEILSNNSKKADYDKARKFYSYGTSSQKTYNKTTTNPNFKETYKEEKKSSFWDELFAQKSEVKVPKKGEDIYSEEGEKGLNGGRNGDLYLTIHIREPKNYKTEGLNILKTIQITPYEAVLGADVNVPTLLGNISMKISPNTRNGQKIRLSGCGIEQNNKVGDMIVTVEIQIPDNLTEEEISLYKQLRDAAIRR